MATTSAQKPGRAFASPRIPVPGWLARWPEWAQVGGFLVILCGISLYLRTKYIGGQYWMDEAITVGISSHSLSAIPGVLRMDGSPPLFYLVLHVWMSLFGNSEVATHSLSLLFGTLTIPVGYWGARSMFGARAGAMAAVLFATNAFITIYSQETRMYALMVLLGLFATIGWLQGFVYRRRRYVILFAVAQGLMLYTHAWALFYGAGSFIALFVLWRLSDDETREHFIRDAIYAYVGAGVLFLPWLPNFVFQTLHTAAPWDTAPRFGAAIQLSRNILGGDRVTAPIVGATVVGLAPLFTRAERRSTEMRVMWMMILIPIFTLALAWASSQFTPAWVARYFAPIVGPLLLLAALGMARAGLVGLVGLLLACAFLAAPGTYAPEFKSDMKDVAGEMNPRLHPGDLVIVGQPEQTPLAYYYLATGLRFTNTASSTILRDPSYMNWVNALKRYKQTNPWKVVPRLLASVKVGQQVLFIRPMTEGAGSWTAPWTRLVRRRSAQWGGIIGADKQLVREAWAPHTYRGACCVADSALLYKKVS
jgi:mannosyltransferase